MINPDERRPSFYEFLSRDQKRLPPELESLASNVVDAFVEVHRELGPGHPERVYENAFCHELSLRHIPFERQVPVRVYYKDVDVGDSVVDVLIDKRLVVELKSVDQLSPTHRAQLGSYLVALKLELGFLANFNVALMKDGIKRVIRSSS